MAVVVGFISIWFRHITALIPCLINKTKASYPKQSLDRNRFTMAAVGVRFFGNDRFHMVAVGFVEQ